MNGQPKMCLRKIAPSLKLTSMLFICKYAIANFNEHFHDRDPLRFHGFDNETRIFSRTRVAKDTTSGGLLVVRCIHLPSDTICRLFIDYSHSLNESLLPPPERYDVVLPTLHCTACSHLLVRTFAYRLHIFCSSI